MRTCKKCGIEKPLDQFEKHKQCREGHTHRCSACAYAAQKEWGKGKEEFRKGYHRRYYLESKGEGYIPRNERKKRSPEQIAAAKQKRKWVAHETMLHELYGISVEDYAWMFVAQNGGCAICGDGPTSEQALAVDHNHATGAVRELLCRGCNIALGGVRDRPDLLDKAAAYLRKHG